MYKIKEISYSNTEPWLVPFEKRLACLFKAKKEGFKIVLYLYEEPDTSTFRYRVYNMCQSLELSLRWRGVYFFEKELERIKRYINEFEVIIAVRYRWSIKFDDFLQLAKKQKKCIVFDVDDLVYTSKNIPLIMNTLSVNFENDSNYDYWFAYTGRLEKSIRECDYVITTNQFIKGKLEEDINYPSYIVPNYMNRLQLMVSEDYYRQKKMQYSRDDFVIGYFSGTPSHINDFLVVAPELMRLLDEYKDIRLRIVGFMELPGYMQRYFENHQIERIPLQNFIDLQKYIAEADVNIVPLINNEFSNCKSELKFFEAGVVGTITCATPSYVFKQKIKPGKNGFLCNPGEWYETLLYLYRNRRKGCTDIVKRAYQDSINGYAYYHQVTLLDEIFDDLCQMTGGN